MPSSWRDLLVRDHHGHWPEQGLQFKGNARRSISGASEALILHQAHFGVENTVHQCECAEALDSLLVRAYLEVVWQLSSASIARVHGDCTVQTAALVQRAMQGKHRHASCSLAVRLHVCNAATNL